MPNEKETPEQEGVGAEPEAGLKTEDAAKTRSLKGVAMGVVAANRIKKATVAEEGKVK
jgi:hypothetical protein